MPPEMRMLTLGLAMGLAVGLGAIGSVLFFCPHRALASGHASASASTSAPGSCVAIPHTCGFPDVTNTGVPEGMTLRSVPGQVSSGPGWSYSPAAQEVDVTGSGAVLSGLSIRGNLNITASNVTIKDDRVVTAGYFGISLRHTTGVMIEDSTISGQNLTTGRVGVAIDDVYGDSTGMVIMDDNISCFRTGVQVSTGLVTGNYIHSFGYLAGDHSNGILDIGTTQSLTIYHNTILNTRGQTDAISLDASAAGKTVANKTVQDNLLAGGSFTIYGGAARRSTTSHIVIEDNRFSTAYYPKSGQYGPVAYFSAEGKGDAWSGNTWIGSGQAALVPLP
jgi:hypothetical protein